MPAFLLPFFKSVLLQLAQFLLRWFLGIASGLWTGLLAEIARLDTDQTLTNEERQHHAEGWLIRRFGGLAEQPFPWLADPDITAWLRRAVQFAVLCVRLRAALSIRTQSGNGTPPPAAESPISNFQSPISRPA